MTSNFIDLLREEFRRRKSKNPAYSLNAFSKQLELDQSLFSKILSGKKRVSDRLASDLLLRAGIQPGKISFALDGFRLIDEGEFEFLSDWLPFAILELAKTQDFEVSKKWMARRLSVHQEEVHLALGLLERFGYIELDLPKKKMKLLKPNNTWSNQTQTSAAKKKLQKKYIEKSAKALDEIPFELRDHGSLTIAISQDQLPLVKEKLARFRKELGAALQKKSKPEEVYQITMSVFPLTKLKNGDQS